MRLVNRSFFFNAIFSGAALLLGALAQGCVVSQARYDEAMVRLDEESAARKGADARAGVLAEQLAELEARLQHLSEAMRQADAALTSERGTAAELRFESDVIAREREDARQMSEQLRMELERVASHLRAFSDDKELLEEERQELSRELQSARDRLDALAADEHLALRRFKAARELTLALAEPLRDETLQVTLIDGQVAVQFPTGALFEPEKASFTAKGQALLERATSALVPLDASVSVHPSLALGTVAKEREQRVISQLESDGVSSQRIVMGDAAVPGQSSTDKEPEAVDETSQSVDADGETRTPTGDGAPASEAAKHGAKTPESDLVIRLHFTPPTS